MRVCGLVVINRQRQEPEYGNHQGRERNVPGPIAQGECLSRQLARILHEAPVGADKRQCVQSSRSHRQLVAFIGHAAALQRVFLCRIPVPSPALELTEVIQQERQRRLFATVKRLPMSVGQASSCLVEPVTPFKDDSRSQRWVEHREAPDWLLARRCVQGLGPFKQIWPDPVALEELEKSDAGERVRYQPWVGCSFGRTKRQLCPSGGARQVTSYQSGERELLLGMSTMGAVLRRFLRCLAKVCSASGQPFW